MRPLFPRLKPNREFRLERPGGHEIHVEECGSASGQPVLVLHDGPGAGIDPVQRRMLDAERFRIILFDQRGSGRSRPLAAVQENTLPHLIEDMLAILDKLALDTVMLWGHGWGAALAVAFARDHADRVQGIVLSAFFPASDGDVDQAFARGARFFFPDAWASFAEGRVADSTAAVLAWYAEELESHNELRQMQAARKWAQWIARIQSVHTSQELSDWIQHPHVACALARISCHYYRNGCFLDGRSLVSQSSDLNDLPAIIVHGRFDVFSPLKAAYDLQKRWQGSELYIVRDGSHSLHDPALRDAVMRAVVTLADRLAGREGPIVE